MKKPLTTFLTLLTLIFFGATQAQETIAAADLSPLLGEWKGSLTYVDYSSNQPYTMPANLTVKQGKSANQMTLMYAYPNEPQANSKGKLKISDGGKKLNNEMIVSREVLEDGSIQVTTSYKGKDNNKEALMKGVYVLGASTCIIRKEVKYEDSETWLKRNEYTFER